VLALLIPAGDAIFEFRRSIEVDFLGALHGPILEDAIAAWRSAALVGWLIGTCSSSASIGKSEWSCYGVSGLDLAFDFALSPGLGGFLVAGGKDGLFFANKLVSRGDVTNGAE
jgi:hypothetical protein